MATNLGKVGIVTKGDWSSSATYEVLDAVYYNGGTYIAKQNVPANTLPTNTTYWQPGLTIGDGTSKNVTVSSSLNARYAICRTFGKMVFFYSRFTTTAALSANTELFSDLPSVYAPGLSANYTALGLLICDVNSATFKMATITQNGTVKTTEAIDNNKDCTLWVAYIAL